MTPKSLALSAALALAAAAAQAAPEALVIGNSRYDRIQTLFGAKRVLEAAQALEEQGVEVTAVRDADSAAMREAFGTFLDRLGEDSAPVLVILAGAFVHGPDGSYLLPAVGEDRGADKALVAGFSLDSALAVLARYPGEAVLLLGETPDTDEAGPYLKPGLGALNIPQGVTVLRGAAPDVARFANGVLPDPGALLLAEAEAAELTVEGFAPRDFTYLTVEDLPSPEPEPEAPEDPEPTAEEQAAAEEEDAARAEADAEAWAEAQEGDDVAAYEAYLEDFPEGDEAAAARQRITAIEAEPFYEERRAEEALELDRDARRAIQRDLTILGYDTRGIDGIFGAGTRGGVRQWQDTQDIEASGYLTRDQITRLDAQAERRAAELEAEAEERRRQQEQAERTFWQETGARGDEAGLRAYLTRYPEGTHAEEARRLLDDLEEQRRRRAGGQDRIAWEEARQADTVSAYRSYLEARPGGAFVNEARGRIEELQRNADRQRAALRARDEEQGLGLNTITRRLAEARLGQLGLNPGEVDGEFTAQTRSAIETYQQDRALEVTGYLDQETVVRLLADGILGLD